ncbi:hypothetical protein HK103_003247 [Boothiomyces macroporosus]|uniref:Uncharacterized protein n=1 Tax=Boothiomyces macroporosus TaxID=261099 RepID=A0AAD5UJ27_9FUNG|nr:hypothetical protein HK103_003247 [Boothiomyces macroporosus]
MNTPPPLFKRFLAQFRRPIVAGPLTFLAGAFWINTILNNTSNQKSNTAVFRGIIYAIEAHPEISKVLGNRLVYKQSIFNRVKGYCSVPEGVADLTFTVEGKDGRTAEIHFEGKRYRDTDSWVSSVFTVNADKLYNLQ